MTTRGSRSELLDAKYYAGTQAEIVLSSVDSVEQLGQKVRGNSGRGIDGHRAAVRQCDTGHGEGNVAGRQNRAGDAGAVVAVRVTMPLTTMLLAEAVRVKVAGAGVEVIDFGASARPARCQG